MESEPLRAEKEEADEEKGGQGGRGGGGKAAEETRPIFLMVMGTVLTILDLFVNYFVFGQGDESEGVQVNEVPGIASPPAATFSIWGIIFLWQFVYLVAQFGLCGLDAADVRRIAPGIIACQVLQTLYGLTLFLPGTLLRLLVSSAVIALCFGSFMNLTWSLRNHEVCSGFFWLTFGYTINCAWLLLATYVQWSILFVYIELPMNRLQVPFLLFVILAILLISLSESFRYPPAFFLVSAWTFTFQALLWDPRAEADKVFSLGVQRSYWLLVVLTAILSVPAAGVVFKKKLAISAQPDQ